MKSEKAITLIALIITIIVMLILVGVTINFALNGGIITKSKEASSQMQKAADKEELQLAIIASMDYLEDEINETELKANLKDWTVTGNGPYTCVSPNKNSFTVTKAGVISNGETPSEEEEEEPIDQMDFYLSTISNEPGSNGINGMGAIISKNNSLVYTAYYIGEPLVMTKTFLLMNAFGQYRVINNFTVSLNGEDVTYEQAILEPISIFGDVQYRLYGYIDNNQIKYLNVTGDTEDASSFDENNNMIVYTSITDKTEGDLTGMNFTKSNLPQSSSFNLDTYEYETEYGKHLISLDKSKNVLYLGGNVEDFEVSENQELFNNDEEMGIAFAYYKLLGIFNYDLYMSRLTYTTVNTFEAQMSDQTTRTYNNVIVATQEDTPQDGIVNGRNTPIGYINNAGNFVRFNCTFDSRDGETGYPTEYTSWEEVAYTKR